LRGINHEYDITIHFFRSGHFHFVWGGLSLFGWGQAVAAAALYRHKLGGLLGRAFSGRNVGLDVHQRWTIAPGYGDDYQRFAPRRWSLAEPDRHPADDRENGEID
jgi:hypothetical protein